MNHGTTPSQTVGPYFSIGLQWLNHTDLTSGAETDARVTIHGHVLDGEGQPVPDAFLEIWQADAGGTYAHPEDGRPIVAGQKFFGFGRVPTNDQGEFSFTTIKPGSVPGPDGKPQAPHLQISVFMRGLLQQLVTRLYFPGEAANSTDLVLGLVPPERRGTLIARQRDSKETLLEWNVRLQGDQETVFFEC